MKDYITAKQFHEQTPEVQEVLLSWWKPKCFNLVSGNKTKTKTILKEHEAIDDLHHKIKRNFTPLFSESQLRHFIQDTADCKMDIMFMVDEFQFNICNKETCQVLRTLYSSETDLFLSYWQIACEIALEVK